MKKKILTFILIMSMLFLTACSEDPYMLGIYTLNGYASQYLGFRFVTPDGFTLFESEELRKLMNESAAEDGDETINTGDSLGTIQQKYQQMDSIYEMIVIEESGETQLLVALQKTWIPLSIFIEGFKLNLTEQYENVEFSDRKEEVVIGEAAYTKIESLVNIEGEVQNMDVYFREVDNRIMCISIFWIDGEEEKRDMLLDAFGVN